MQDYSGRRVAYTRLPTLPEEAAEDTGQVHWPAVPGLRIPRARVPRLGWRVTGGRAAAAYAGAITPAFGGPLAWRLHLAAYAFGPRRPAARRYAEVAGHLPEGRRRAQSRPPGVRGHARLRRGAPCSANSPSTLSALGASSNVAPCRSLPPRGERSHRGPRQAARIASPRRTSPTAGPRPGIWLRHSHNGGASWEPEQHLHGPFDHYTAPILFFAPGDPRGLFLGDYMGPETIRGNDVINFFASTISDGADVHAIRANHP